MVARPGLATFFSLFLTVFAQSYAIVRAFAKALTIASNRQMQEICKLSYANVCILCCELFSPHRKLSAKAQRTVINIAIYRFNQRTPNPKQTERKGEREQESGRGRASPTRAIVNFIVRDMLRLDTQLNTSVCTHFPLPPSLSFIVG